MIDLIHQLFCRLYDREREVINGEIGSPLPHILFQIIGKQDDSPVWTCEIKEDAGVVRDQQITDPKKIIGLISGRERTDMLIVRIIDDVSHQKMQIYIKNLIICQLAVDLIKISTEDLFLYLRICCPIASAPGRHIRDQLLSLQLQRLANFLLDAIIK